MVIPPGDAEADPGNRHSRSRSVCCLSSMAAGRRPRACTKHGDDFRRRVAVDGAPVANVLTRGLPQPLLAAELCQRKPTVACDLDS